MFIHALPDVVQHKNPIAHASPQLIAALGTAQFEQSLRQILKTTLGCAVVNAFLITSERDRRVMLAASEDISSEARNKEYLVRFWNEDPAHKCLENTLKLPRGVLVYIPRDEMAGIQYRRALYSETSWHRLGSKLIERVSLIRRRGNDILRIGLYRHADFGPFSAAQIQTLFGAADLLFSLIVKHEACFAPCADPSGRISQYATRLHRVAPPLSARETEVCAGIAAGLTSEAIAIRLGIKLNTVLSHRRSAYARLRISTQNELLSRILFPQRAPFEMTLLS